LALPHALYMLAGLAIVKSNEQRAHRLPDRCQRTS
jgi:hypothetical protein